MSNSFDVDCSVRISHTFEDLSAHVELDGEPNIRPGDVVHVHGPALTAPYGTVRVERRRATVVRGSIFDRLVARVRGQVDCLSLLEVSFGERTVL